MKAGRNGDLERLADLLKASEQADSGLVCEFIMRDQSDANRIYVFAVFESEAKARARETDPRRQDAQVEVRQLMGDMLMGAPEYADMSVFAQFASQAAPEFQLSLRPPQVRE
jgi:quinol monooxygenase YgiN